MLENYRRLIAAGSVAAGVLICLAGNGWAQGEKVVIVGTATDTSGAVIPGVQVTITRVSTNESQSAITGDTGDYAFRGLVPDIYDIQASLSGFKMDLRRHVKLDTGRTYRFDFKMTVGEISEKVEVTGTNPMLRTETPDLGQVIDNEKIIGLPLNSRDIFGSLGALTPGLQPTRRGGVAYSGGIQFNVKGMRQGDNIALIDGTMVSETNGASQFNVNPDAVQEFEIKTGLYGAEYGIKSGGQFSAVTKSGTNDLHGTLFEFLRNDNLDARNFFDPGPRPEYKRNQFGAVIGGPIYLPGLFKGKDKAWWFFSYAGERVRRFVSLTATVPTAAEKAGTFAQTITDPVTGTPFPNNSIPQNRMDQNSLKFLGFWPDPNTAAGRGFNYTSSTSGNQDQDQIIAKVDFRTSKDMRWSARFLRHNAPNLSSNPISIFTVTQPLTSWAQNLTNTTTILGKIVNEAGIHYYRRGYNPGIPPGGPETFASSLNIKGFPAKGIDALGVPILSLSGYAGIGSQSLLGAVPEGQWEGKEQASWTMGSHLIKAGYHYRHHYFYEGLDYRSSFGFTNDRFTGNAFANFLLGYLTSSSQGREGRMNAYLPEHFFFYQDTWKVSDKVTLSLGMRYELRVGWRDNRGYLSNIAPDCVAKVNPNNPLPQCYDPPLEIANPVFPATGRFTPNADLFHWTKNGWQPRVGVAYRASSNTVIRSGFGVYGNEPPGGMMDGGLLNNPRPNTGVQNFTAGTGAPTLFFSDPFNTSALVPGAGLPTIYGFENPLPQFNIYNWGLTVERRLTERMMFEVGYQGTKGVHEIQVTQYNDAAPGPGARQSRRPFPGVQNYTLMTSNGDRNYHGLEVRFEKRPGPEGVTTLLAYTWSKSLDTVGGRLGVPGDPGGISRNMTTRDNYGRGEADIPGRFSLMLGYDLPFGPGRTHMVDNVLGKILGGWSFNGILSAQKGQWMTAVDSVDRLDVGTATNQRPQLLGNPNLPTDQRRPEQWFNTAAFGIPPQYTYGNAGRGIIEGPGLFNIDLAVLRSFRPTEGTRIEFRFETFNATNHPSFNIPGTSFGVSSFGVIGSAFEARDLQFGLKFYF